MGYQPRLPTWTAGQGLSVLARGSNEAEGFEGAGGMTACCGGIRAAALLAMPASFNNVTTAVTVHGVKTLKNKGFPSMTMRKSLENDRVTSFKSPFLGHYRRFYPRERLPTALRNAAGNRDEPLRTWQPSSPKVTSRT